MTITLRDETTNAHVPGEARRLLSVKLSEASITWEHPSFFAAKHIEGPISGTILHIQHFSILPPEVYTITTFEHPIYTTQKPCAT